MPKLCTRLGQDTRPATAYHRTTERRHTGTGWLRRKAAQLQWWTSECFVAEATVSNRATVRKCAGIVSLLRRKAMLPCFISATCTDMATAYPKTIRRLWFG